MTEMERQTSYELEALRDKVKYLTAAILAANEHLKGLPALYDAKAAYRLLKDALAGEWKP